MNLLFIAPRLPYPADTGGKIRTINILKQIARHANVHLVCFSFDPKDEEYQKVIEKDRIKVTLVAMKESSFLEKANNVLLNAQPHSIAKYDSLEMFEEIKRIVSKEKFDAVHVDHLHMGHYRSCFADLPAVLDEHNVEYRILERCVDVEKSWLKRQLFLFQAAKMKKFEQKIIQEFSACLAVSQDDQKLLNELGLSHIPVHVIPNGVDTDFFRTQDIKIKAPEAVVFTGSMDWLPNDDAAVYFCNEILPLIWKDKPNLKFYIVGKSTSSTLQDFAKNDSRVVVTGRVEDVRVFVDNAQVFVVPIRVGGGTRLKILEAMSMQKPIVSTTLGAEGIQYTNGKDIVIADSPADFSKSVIDLLNNFSFRETMGQMARKLVVENYDWPIIGKKLNAIYEGLCSKR
jgi:sugar transferase (PEP-CTERM/EpsH1 system associated)